MKLTLVGAGPGDPDLISLKGVKALNLADVILYDALANPILLNHASSEAELIYVGKRKGKHSVSQEEINRIIIQNALSGKHVVRLKGGDPVVFGRGFEEMEVVAALGIETELIPGISSCISIPSLNGIPVTKRGVADSFWVLTGHTKTGTLPEDMKLAAQSNATIVILMGISKIAEIVEIFSKHDKGHSEVVVIQNGSMPNQNMVRGKVCEIEKEIEKHSVGNPAVIVIGEAVKKNPNLVYSYLNSNSLLEEETR